MKAAGNMALSEIISCIDHNYRLITYAIKVNKLDAKHPAAQYKRVWSRLLIQNKAGKQLILLDSAQIVIPTCTHKKLLKLIHRAHSGYTKSYKTVMQLYYWQGIKSNIADN